MHESHRIFSHPKVTHTQVVEKYKVPLLKSGRTRGCQSITKTGSFFSHPSDFIYITTQIDSQLANMRQ